MTRDELVDDLGPALLTRLDRMEALIMSALDNLTAATDQLLEHDGEG
ncbi:MAG: hypothetical protein ACRCZP_13050 [Phycicoccus sp.]